MDLLDVPPIPFSDPSLGAGAPHLGATDGHATALPGTGCWSRSERRSAVPEGRENEFGWNVFAESVVDLAHLLTFRVGFLLLVEKGVGGGGHWAHGEVLNGRSQKSDSWAWLRLHNAVVIRGDHDRIEVKDEGRGAVGILGTATRRHRVGGGQIDRG